MTSRITSKKIETEKKIRRKRWATGISISIFIILVTFFILLWIPAFRINSIEIKGAQSLFPSDISNFIEKKSKYRCGILPCNSRIILRPSNLEDMVTKEFKRISAVSIHYKKIQNVIITIIERSPRDIWCTENESIAENCWYMDSTGYIFDKAPFFSDGVYMKWSGGVTTSTEPIGSTVETSFSFGDIDTLTNHLLETETIITKINLVSEKHTELEIIRLFGYDVPLDSIIIVNPELGVDENINVLEILHNDIKFNTKLKNQSEQLKYLDIRFSDKIYYKFE